MLRVEPMHDRRYVAERMREIGALLRVRGDSRFRARAFARGAAALESLAEPRFEALLAERRLTELGGIGTTLADQAYEIAERGSSRYLDTLRAELPAGVVELTNVMSLAKARALHTALGVATLDDLERACREERVRGVRGFGPKTEEKLLRAVAEYRARPNRLTLLEARDVAAQIEAHLVRSGWADRVEVAGAVRRWAETTDEITLVAQAQNPAALIADAAALPMLARVEERTDDTLQGRLSNGVRARVHAARAETFASALLVHTGSEAHVARLGDVKDMPAACEADIYRARGLAYVPPELREDAGEIERARQGEIRLVRLSDVRGMVHCHTTYSDGRDSIEAMAKKAEEMGLEYLTITDHSPTAHYAGGVTVDRLRAQWDEIARVQENVKVRILRGTESDILADGALDYPDAILEQLDVIIASVHARMGLGRAEMTRRLVCAMKHPAFKIWGHPLGRLVLRREPIACDVEEVLDAAAGARAAIEVNGDPYRLDLEPRWIREARARGLSFVISTDAHSTRGMENLIYGVAMARRGGLEAGDVLNTRSADGFARAVAPRT